MASLGSGAGSRDLEEGMALAKEAPKKRWQTNRSMNGLLGCRIRGSDEAFSVRRSQLAPVRLVLFAPPHRAVFAVFAVVAVVLVRPDHQRVAFPIIHAILKVSLDRLLGLRFLSLLESWRRRALRLVVSLEYSKVIHTALA